MKLDVDQAISLGRLLLDLGARVFGALARGDVDRVDRIIPGALRTSLARARADAELEDELAHRRTIDQGSPGAGHQ